jgi:hypothetical protein
MRSVVHDFFTRVGLFLTLKTPGSRPDGMSPQAWKRACLREAAGGRRRQHRAPASAHRPTSFWRLGRPAPQPARWIP